MSNRFCGETTIQHEGEAYTLRLDFNAMVDFEELVNQPALDALAKFETGELGIKGMRALMFACLQAHHGGLSIRDAGDILSTNPEALQAVLQAAIPEAEAGADSGKPKGRKS